MTPDSAYVQLDAGSESGTYRRQPVGNRKLIFIIGLLMSAFMVVLTASCRAGPLPTFGPTMLWTWGSVWSGVVRGTGRAINETKSAVQNFNGSHAAHEAERTWKGVVRSADRAINKTKSAVQHFNGSRAAHEAEHTWKGVVAGTDTAFNKTKSALDHFNSTQATNAFEHALKKAKAEAEHCWCKIADGIKSSVNKSSFAMQELKQGFEIKGAEHAIGLASQTTGNATTRVPHWHRAEQLTAPINMLHGTSSNYTIPPCCLDAIELGAILAGGGAVPAILVRVMGFTSRGVEARSLASLWQSTIGNIEKGSIFSYLQSKGATGALVKNALVVAGKEAAYVSAFCSSIFL